jgi:hypothetical protein
MVGSWHFTQGGLIVIKRVVKTGDTARRWGVVRAGLISFALALALLYTVASVALAAPKGIFAKLAQCPAGRAGVAVCIHAEITGGVIAVGNVSIPIAPRPIVIQSGAVPTGGANFNEYFLSPATKRGKHPGKRTGSPRRTAGGP